MSEFGDPLVDRLELEKAHRALFEIYLLTSKNSAPVTEKKKEHLHELAQNAIPQRFLEILDKYSW